MYVYDARKITLSCKALKPVVSICTATHTEMGYKKIAAKVEKQIWKVETY